MKKNKEINSLIPGGTKKQAIVKNVIEQEKNRLQYRNPNDSRNPIP